jgi:mannosyltransferase OCH1-like enzyme
MVIIANRLIKILGLIIKGLSYIFHFILPNKRFIIPFESKPIIKSNKNSSIPKILWQTNYSNRVSFPIYVNYLFNRLMSYNYEYRYYGNEECLEFIETHGTSDEFESYKKLKDGAAKADFWRVFALYKYGGVYLDMDGTFVWSVDGILENQSELFVVPRRGKYTNYFLATAPNNHIFRDTIDIIVDNIQNISSMDKEKISVYTITGPSAVEKAIGEKEVNSKIYKLVCSQGTFTNEYFQYIDKKNGKWIHTAKDQIVEG